MAITERDEEVYALYADQGLTQRQIGRKLGIAQPTVHAHIRKVERHELRRTQANLELVKIRQHRQLIHIYRESMKGWERSLGDDVKRTHKWKDGPNGPESSQDITVAGQAGDPRFLIAADKALASLRSLWGLDAPTQIDSSHTYKVPAGMTPEAARARAEAVKVTAGDLESPAEQAIRTQGQLLPVNPVNPPRPPNPDLPTIDGELVPPAERG